MYENLYSTLWAIYGASALIAFFFLWGFTRWQGKARYLGGLIRLLFVVVMLTPAQLNGLPDLLAPAFVVAPLDFFQGYGDSAFDAAMNLGVASFVAIFLYSIIWLIGIFVHFRKKS